MDISVSGNASLDLCMLHGIQGTNLAWSEIATELERDYRCIRPNFEGRGKRKANFNASALTLDHYASELHSILQSYSSSGVVLIGWSLGVSVILEYLSKYDHSPISGIVLISGSPALNECEWFKQSEPQALKAEILEREQHLQLIDAAHPAAVAALWSNIKSINHEALLPTITTPCLVIHGEKDEDCPIEHGQRLAAAIPNAKLISIPEAEHPVLRSHPTLVIDSVREFIQHL